MQWASQACMQIKQRGAAMLNRHGQPPPNRPYHKPAGLLVPTCQPAIILHIKLPQLIVQLHQFAACILQVAPQACKPACSVISGCKLYITVSANWPALVMRNTAHAAAHGHPPQSLLPAATQSCTAWSVPLAARQSAARLQPAKKKLWVQCTAG